jgi:hypothetical protein
MAHPQAPFQDDAFGGNKAPSLLANPLHFGREKSVHAVTEVETAMQNETSAYPMRPFRHPHFYAVP